MKEALGDLLLASKELLGISGINMLDVESFNKIAKS